jgi:hypothetical protein
MLTVTGAIFTLLNPTGSMFQAQPEVVDMQQRLRIGVDTLTRDLMMAGAGAYSGSQSGNLASFFAPIQPSIQGNDPTLDSGPGLAFTDKITIFYVPSTSGQTSISDPMPPQSAELKVNNEPGCPSGQNLCGFQEGMQVLIYDDTGAYDTMTITQVQDNAGHLQHNQQGPLSKQYDSGAKVVQYQDHVYFLDAMTRQLKHYDGYQTVTPVLDEVVGLSFEYFGEAAPPALIDPSKGQDVTYGPKPRAMSAAAVDGWPVQGENCTIQVVGGLQVPRLANLGTGLVKLTSAQMTDGPWCPNATNANRFDADLFRIRMIRVTLRLQTGNASLRGNLMQGTDALWTVPGTATGAKMVPDQQIKFEVTPRNMNLAR